MQIMYVLTFLVTLFIITLTQGRDDARMVNDDSAIAAEHMVIWHTYATKACVAVPCARGEVDVVGKLPPQLADGPAFTPNRFSSRYDAANNQLVTYMPSSSAAKGTVTFGTVNTALQELAARAGEASQVGVWNSSTRTVVFGVWTNGAPRTVVLPSPFEGGFIPDGSPVLVSHP